MRFEVRRALDAGRRGEDANYGLMLGEKQIWPSQGSSKRHDSNAN